MPLTLVPEPLRAVPLPVLHVAPRGLPVYVLTLVLPRTVELFGVVLLAPPSEPSVTVSVGVEVEEAVPGMEGR